MGGRVRMTRCRAPAPCVVRPMGHERAIHLLPLVAVITGCFGNNPTSSWYGEGALQLTLGDETLSVPGVGREALEEWAGWAEEAQPDHSTPSAWAVEQGLDGGAAIVWPVWYRTSGALVAEWSSAGTALATLADSCARHPVDGVSLTVYLPPDHTSPVTRVEIDFTPETEHSGDPTYLSGETGFMPLETSDEAHGHALGDMTWVLVDETPGTQAVECTPGAPPTVLELTWAFDADDAVQTRYASWPSTWR